jgi:succinate dehydrogenase / fumarate reductase cytochrome b subunit
MENQPAANKFIRWFDPRNRQVGSWAFILNRITAIGLTFYLFLHLIVLSSLAQGAEAYDSFIELATSPIFKFGELFVIAGGLIHGLNGIRIGITSFGFGTRLQKEMFFIVLAISIIGTVIFAVKMFIL